MRKGDKEFFKKFFIPFLLKVSPRDKREKEYSYKAGSLVYAHFLFYLWASCI
jgi:hypothetical protein